MKIKTHEKFIKKNFSELNHKKKVQLIVKIKLN